MQYELMRKLLASLCALLPLQALAAVAIVNTPSTINDAANYTAETGSNRVVAICIRGEVAAGTTTLDVSDISFGAKTLGGAQIVLGAKLSNTADWTREFVGIYYVKEANIPAGANAITVTWNQAVAGTTAEITAYTLSGVNQTTAVDTTTSARFPASGSTGTTDHFVASAPTVANNTVQIHCGEWNATGNTGTVKGTGWAEDVDTAGSGIHAYGSSKTTATGATLDFWGETVSAGIQGLGAVVSFAPTVTPTYSAGPAASSTNATTITDSLTPSASATEYAVAYSDVLSAPSCTQVKAGQDVNGATALAANNKSVSGADTIVLTPSAPVLYRYNTAHCLNNAGGDSAVSVVTNRVMAAPTGYQFVAITSIGTGSPCASFNTATNPDIANGDYLKAPTTTSPGSFALTIGADCQFSYPGDSSRQSALGISVYDASVGAYHADSIDFWANNLAPIPPTPPGSIVWYFPLNQAITPIDLSQYCPDPEGDTVVVTSVSGLAHGLSITNSVLSGTPDTQAISTLTLRCTDTPGDSVDWN